MKRILENPYIYNFYQYLVGTKPYLTYLAKNIVLLENTRKVLDLGCGTANILSFLGNEIEYTGLDISTKYLNYSTKKFENQKFINADICKPVQLDEKFDVIFSEGVMAALDDESLKKMFETIVSLSRSQTRIILSDMNFREDACWLQKFLQSNERNKNLRDKTAYLQLLTEYFEVINIWELNDLYYIPNEKVVFECRIKQS